MRKYNAWEMLLHVKDNKFGMANVKAFSGETHSGLW